MRDNSPSCLLGSRWDLFLKAVLSQSGRGRKVLYGTAKDKKKELTATVNSNCQSWTVKSLHVTEW